MRTQGDLGRIIICARLSHPAADQAGYVGESCHVASLVVLRLSQGGCVAFAEVKTTHCAKIR